MSDFRQGDKVFLRDGSEAVYVAAADDGGHIVRKVYDGDEGEVLGKPVLAREVFAMPPVERVAAEMREAERRLAEINTKLAEARKEETAFRADAKEREALFEQNLMASRLADFLAGRIAHIVRWGWGGPSISTLAEALKSDEDRYDKKLKLVVLFGDTKNRDLDWRLNRYSDGSGGSESIIPCRSLEEARAIAQQKIDAICADDRCEEAVESADRLGLSVPVDVRKKAKAATRARAQKSVADAEKILAAAQAELAKLPPEPEPGPLPAKAAP